MKIFRFLLLSGIQLVVNCSAAGGGAGGSSSNDINELNDTDLQETKAFEYFLESTNSFSLFHSHKIPLTGSSVGYRYHGADEDLIKSMTEATKSALHISFTTSPILFYERPGTLFFDKDLHEVCAEFRVSKSSIDPSAYSKQEKIEFLDKIGELGVFCSVEPVSTVKGSSKKNQKVREELQHRAILSASIMVGYFCRDALRLAASALNSNQLSWLLEYSTIAIVGNPELLDQLEDFSMFNEFHVISGLVDGNYDWFKNAKALKTLPTRSLRALISEFNYNLSFEQLDLLNASRPIAELLQTTEFITDPFVWQMTAGTIHFRDEHIKIEELIELIREEESMTDDIKLTVFGIYVHTEICIMSHILSFNANITGRDDNSIDARVVDSGVISSDNIDASVVDSIDASGDNSVVDASVDNIKAQFHINALKVFFYQRKMILSSLIERNERLNEIEVLNLIKLFKTPSTKLCRKAIKLIEEVKRDNIEMNVDILIRLLKRSQGSQGYQTALIFGYFDEIPYDDEIENTRSEIIKTFEIIFPSKDIFTFSKWIKIFFIQQLYDGECEVSEVVEGEGEGESESESDVIEGEDVTETNTVTNTIANPVANPVTITVTENQFIIDQFLQFCNLNNFLNFEIEFLKEKFPEISKNLILKIEKNKFKEFFKKFNEILKFYKEKKEKIFNLEISEILKMIFLISIFECKISSLIQNQFEPLEMMKYLVGEGGEGGKEDGEVGEGDGGDGEVNGVIGVIKGDINGNINGEVNGDINDIIGDFSNFSHCLKRSQIIELLSIEDGRKFLKENRNFLHNLSTFEDFKSSDIKSLNFQAQYATMVRTLPLIPLLISFKLDGYIFNNPESLSWRLFSNIERIKKFNQKELLQISWKIVPFQVLVENWKSSNNDSQISRGVDLYPYNIRYYLTNTKEVIGKPLEALKQVLHWIILQEIKFLEAFMLINSGGKSTKWNDALNAAVYYNYPEQTDRDFIIDTWLPSMASNHPEIQSKLRSNFLFDFLEVIGGPLSQLRGGAFLVARKEMDMNMRMMHFSEYFVGFHSWAYKISNEVKSLSLVGDNTKIKDKGSNTKAMTKMMSTSKSTISSSSTISTSTSTTSASAAAAEIPNNPNSNPNNPNTGTSTSSNILQYRNHLEQEIKNRQNIILKMLSELDSVTVENPNNQLWVDRVKLLGMFSADGFTLSPSFNLTEPFINLPLHEMILYKRLRQFSKIDEDIIDNDMRLNKWALTAVQFMEGSKKEEKGKKNTKQKRK